MILVTGGTGYIGSHMVVALEQAGLGTCILDNLSNSSKSVVARMARICGRTPVFMEGDVRDRALLDRIFAEQKISGVIHFAGLKAVGESVQKPLEYYDNNLAGTLALLGAMRQTNVRTLIFSSSATVYGTPDIVPIKEGSPRYAVNPYGRSKLMIEDVLIDLHAAEPAWRIALLRYFNPAGAHQSGLLGEHPKSTPNNLMPYIVDVAKGRREMLKVFGGDYPTRDGTGVRDYIHVMDLAEGHLAALRYLETSAELLTVNLGTGGGVSVLEMIRAFEDTNGCKVPYRVVARRAGDVPESYADVTLAKKLLKWRASRSLEDICRDAWASQDQSED